MSAWELPTALNIGGTDYKIRADFRAVLDILQYFSDPEYEADEKWEICLRILFEDFETIPREHMQEAALKAVEFIEMGMHGDENKKSPTVMDWEQDAHMIIPAVNKVLGMEVRGIPFLHWWTFLAAYMEIGDSLFSHVIGIRQKRAKGKKLDKSEQEFARENKRIVELKKKYTQEELEEQAALNRLLGG